MKRSIGSFSKQWHGLLSKKFLLPDLLASLSVAASSLPLSLAVALASGARPAAGIITSVVAGVICGLFGGTTLHISGPAASLSVLIAEIIATDGAASLSLIAATAGVFQILTGYFGLGATMRLIPRPVLVALSSALAVTIVVDHLSLAVDLPPLAHDVVVKKVLTEFRVILSAASPTAFLIAAISFAASVLTRRLSPRLPSAAVAVALSGAAAWAFGASPLTVAEYHTFTPIQIEDLDDFVRSNSSAPFTGPPPPLIDFAQLPPLALPRVPLSTFFLHSLLVWALSTIETIHSLRFVDFLTQTHRHETDRTLLAEGLANVAVAFVGGMPSAGLFERSNIAVAAGGRTRRTPILQVGSIFLSFSPCPCHFLSPIFDLVACVAFGSSCSRRECDGAR
jgi:MFS superfamily sulfate permease-like transporter